jgi:VanZ family protein
MLLPHRLSRPVRLGLYALATAILLAMCVIPSEELPSSGKGDRFEHTVAWFVLTLTGYVLAPNRLWAIPAFAVVYGVAMEILQGVAPTGRHSDPLDLAADILGVALAMVVFAAVRLFARR